MEDLLSGFEFDPIVSSLGLLVVILGIWLIKTAVKTVMRLLFLLVILVGAFVFFYGGTITG